MKLEHAQTKTKLYHQNAASTRHLDQVLKFNLLSKIRIYTRREMRLVLSFPFLENAQACRHTLITARHDCNSQEISVFFFFACFAIASTRTHAVDSYKSESQPRIDGNSNGKHFCSRNSVGRHSFLLSMDRCQHDLPFNVHYDWHVNH